jgi:hypothetical protein
MMIFLEMGRRRTLQAAYLKSLTEEEKSEKVGKSRLLECPSSWRNWARDHKWDEVARVWDSEKAINLSVGRKRQKKADWRTMSHTRYF